MSDDGDSAAVCSCKAGEVAAEFDLSGIHEELAREWTREDGPGVRSLAEEFNKRVLRAAFRSAGTLPLAGEVDNVYRLLTDDEVSEADRTRARERLRQTGIAIEELEGKMVSHQTLYRHLRNCLDAEHEPTAKTPAERIDEWETRLHALQGRTENVTRQGIQQLRRHDAVDISSIGVSVDVTISCEDCGAFFSVTEFLETGACECSDARAGHLE